MYQQIIIVGNVGRDPELKYTQAGIPVADFSVAVNKRTGRGEERRDETTWFRVTCWRQLAELVNSYVKKGRQVMVIGEVKANAYTDNSGQARASLDITARDVRFLGGRDSAGFESDEQDSGGYGGGYGGGSNDFTPPGRPHQDDSRGGFDRRQDNPMDTSPPSDEGDVPF